MTYYSKQCKDTWIETDITTMNSAVELALKSQIISMNEFMYIVCPVCPYMCGSARFCWGSYVKFRYENEGQNYKNIMKVLIEALYNEDRVDTFHFFRKKICKACESDCKQVYLGTHCTEKYLDQLKDRPTMGYGKKTTYLVPKKATFPLVSISGDTMLGIINRLWKTNDEINSKERAYCPED